MPVRANTQVQLFWEDRKVAGAFRAGVSLHSHTMYSEESLEVIPSHIVDACYRTGCLRRPSVNGESAGRIRLGDAFWTPPLSPHEAYRLEQRQIETELQLPGLISLTDHDDIRAGTLLRVLSVFPQAPIGAEWSVPFGPTFFHVGVHNLCAALSASLMSRLTAFTAAPEPSTLGDILAMLNSDPEVLVVLNHPLWDEKEIGKFKHVQVLRDLLRRHGHQIHALEANGFRSWPENRDVLQLAAEFNLPVVAGGDRHGLEPNAVLNLSRASTLAGFIREVRDDRVSHMVFMPQYRQPRLLRILHSVIDVLRDYPQNFGGYQAWGDRVFYRDPETMLVEPFSSMWNGGTPRLVKYFLSAARLLDRRPPSVILKAA